MITFRPLDALLDTVGSSGCTRFYSDEEKLLIFAHFADAYHNPNQRGQTWEALNDTSGINCRELAPFSPRNAGKEAWKRVALVLQHTGWETPRGMLLWRMGIRSVADLEKPITIAGRAPKWGLEWWGNQVGRWYKKPGKNQFHPEARWVDRVELNYHPSKRAWSVAFFYDYRHDGGSSWAAGVGQRRGESLGRFGDRVSAFIAEEFEPEDRNGPLYRPERERAWHRVHDAMEALFPWHNDTPPDYAKQVADILVDVDGMVLTHGRFQMTRRRLGTLKRWAREAVLKSRKEGGE